MTTEEFQIGHDRSGKDRRQRVSDELLMSSNLRVKRSTFKKFLKLLSAKMPVIWKPVAQSIRCTWNNLLAKLRLTSWLTQNKNHGNGEMKRRTFPLECQCEWTEL